MPGDEDERGGTDAHLPDNALPKFTFTADATSGQSATPENSANHPLVSGHAPFVKRSHTPPPAARSVQAQAATKPSAPAIVQRAISVSPAPAMRLSA